MEFAASGSLRPRWPEASCSCRRPHAASISILHQPPFASASGRGQVASALRAGAATRERSPASRSLWTQLPTHVLGKNVVPGAECVAGQSLLAPGTRGGFAGSLSNPESECGGLCLCHFRDLQNTRFRSRTDTSFFVLCLLLICFGSFSHPPFFPTGHLHSFVQSTNFYRPLYKALRVQT